MGKRREMVYTGVIESHRLGYGNDTFHPQSEGALPNPMKERYCFVVSISVQVVWPNRREMPKNILSCREAEKCIAPSCV